MLGNFLNFSIVALGIGILFALPVFLTRVQKPTQFAPLPLVFVLSLSAFLISYSLFAFVSATIYNVTGACSGIQNSSFCIPVYTEQAVQDSVLARELWLRNLLPPPLRAELCFVGHNWVCESATAILDYVPQWSDYLYQLAFAFFSGLSSLIFLSPFVKAQSKGKTEFSTQALPHQP